MSVFTEGQQSGLSKVRVPYANLAAMGAMTMDDIEEAAMDPDGAIAVDTEGGPPIQAEQAGPRVDGGPAPILGPDLRPIQGSRESMGIVPDGTDPNASPTVAGTGVATAPPTATATTAAAGADTKTRGPRQTITPESRFNPNYRYTNQDFYGDRGPDIYSQNAVGGQMYIPRAGELPMGLFASYQQDTQRKKQQIDQGIADLLKSSQVKPTADPYQPAFTKLVSDWQNNYVAGLSEQYGGNTGLAWKEIAKPGSDANKAYLDGMKAMDALGQFVKFQWADAESYIKDVMKGDIQATPDQKQRATDVYYGIGNLKGDMAGGDFVKLAQETEALKRDMNEAKWVKEYALPLFPEVYRKVAMEPVVKMVGGKRVLAQRTKEEADAAAFKAMARLGSEAIGIEAADLEARLSTLFPRVKSETETLKFFPESKSKGSKSKTDGDASGPTIVSSVVTAPAKQQGGVVKGGEQALRFTPYQETGKKQHKVGKVNLSTGDGSVDIYAPALQWNEDGGEWVITGTSLSESEQTTLKDAMKEEGFDADKELANTADFVTTLKLGKPKSVKVSSNGDAMEVYWKSRDPYEVVAMQLRQRGYDDATPESVKSLWENKRARLNVIKSLQ